MKGEVFMSKYYLRVEAVNLANSVYDTHDISTIRGGSFMLLNSVKQLEKKYEKIYEGASSGLYFLKGCNDSDMAEEIRQEVIDDLNTMTTSYATFVVDYYDFDQSDKDFQTGVKMLMAKNRWSQWQQQTAILPSRNKTNHECDLDGIRPGFAPVPPMASIKFISEFTEYRKRNGQSLRNSIYKEILPDLIEKLSFTDSLEDLANDPSKGNLDGKIAFIYVDGNKFGRIRDERCENEADLKNFDKAIQEGFRSEVLANIIKYASNDDDFKTDNNKNIRLETLLWGGDEVEWVVPAWKAWEVLDMFFAKQPVFKNSNSVITPLTHACGVVFCHHNAPILQIRKIAHMLVDHVKEGIAEIPREHDAGDFIQYLVLESFDMLPSSLKDFEANFYKQTSFNDLQIKGSEIKSLCEHMLILKSYFPHGKIYDIIDAIRTKKSDDEIEKLMEKALKKCSKPQKQLVESAISEIIDKKKNHWFVVADLWDYICERRADHVEAN